MRELEQETYEECLRLITSLAIQQYPSYRSLAAALVLAAVHPVKRLWVSHSPGLIYLFELPRTTIHKLEGKQCMQLFTLGSSVHPNVFCSLVSRFVN